MRRKTTGIIGAALACTALVIASAVGVSCTSSPVNVPVRTFERPQKIDVVCMNVYKTDGSGIRVAPTPVRQSLCAPVAAGVNGELLPYHLYALVTQTSRGEVAVVDLTGGYVVDTDHSTPGINFIPVGAQPTDIAVAPDARMAFVSAAEPNKPALYGIDAHLLLGDSQGLSVSDMQAAHIVTPTLPSLPACSLPQAPLALNVVAREDGSYELLVTLAGTGSTDAQIVSVDPAPLLRGAGLSPADAGGADGASDGAADGGVVIAPGSLAPCILNPSHLILSKRSVPAPAEAPVAWPDGVPYVDGGVDLRGAEPRAPSTCAVPLPPSDGGVPEAGSDGGALDGGVAEGGASDGGDAGMMGSADAGTMGATDAGDAGLAPPIDIGTPRPRAVALDNQSLVLYVADGALPLIHAVDVSVPGVLRELPPLVATSVDDPTRLVTVGGLSISPATRDLRRYLYAVDAKVGSIMVFDVTTPPTEPRPPMRRPHPELNPFQPSDRIAFSSPVAAVAFVRHDWPVTKIGNVPLVAGRTGLLCNPANVDFTALTSTSTDEQLGALYGYGVGNQPVELGPYRLRGVFAFATLTNGSVVTIDVDDWDAPCRRPDPMDTANQLSDLDVPEPAQASGELNPYHVPTAAQFSSNALSANPVTDESYFPAAAPNRTRPNYLLRNDPKTGNHQPTLIGQPQLYSNQAALPTGGTDALVNPAIRATFSTTYDPTFAKDPSNPDTKARGSNLPPDSPASNSAAFSSPGGTSIPTVRLSLEVPDVHVDQDWTVTYEGALPGFNGISAALWSEDKNYQTLKLTAPQGFFCRKGIEDWDVGRERVASELLEMDKLQIPRPADADTWTVDYVQIADDILDASNPYWNPGNDDDKNWARIDSTLKTAQARHDVCQNAYGSINDQTPSVYRDFPILKAYDDQLVIGRFGYSDPNAPVTTNRQVVGSDPSNLQSLLLAYLCFHHQASFRVRAGGEWVAVGSQSGLLHRMIASSSGGDTDSLGTHARCQMSCDARDALLNARAPELLQQDAKGKPVKVNPPDRNSPLAMRNPMFSFAMWAGIIPPPVGNAPLARTTSLRDYVWKFSTRGQLAPLTVPLASGTPQVDPQSMLFIESLGQLAVVDGASQGLVLIDLNIVAPAHAPYF